MVTKASQLHRKMQKDHSETSKLRQLKGGRNASTPESVKRNITNSMMNVRAGSSRRNFTMAPSDFALPQGIQKRKVHSSRASILPTQMSLDTTRISDTESNDIEMGHLYDEYLQKTMTESILKRKAEEMEKSLLSQLATIVKEYDHNEEMMFKLKTRARDIINLAKLQNNIDSQITDVNNCIKGKDIKALENILSELKCLLKPLDVLRCSNMVLPNTLEEWEEIKKSLKLCSETLKSIMNLVGTKSESYESINSYIKEFGNTFNDIEDHQKRLERDLSNLQALVLKSASLSLMQSHN